MNAVLSGAERSAPGKNHSAAGGSPGETGATTGVLITTADLHSAVIKASTAHRCTLWIIQGCELKRLVDHLDLDGPTDLGQPLRPAP